ncbi:MAG: ECF transporter S component [Candidatus Lokiarchaeota archaeon]
MNESKKKSVSSFLGYFLPVKPLPISIIGIFGALTFILTTMIKIPTIATSGYFNVGDIGVMISGILFGPIVGGMAGGIGSSLADVFSGYSNYAIPTLIIKGMEGFIVGLIANPKKHYNKPGIRDILAVIAGGFIMVFGYFIVEIIFYNLPSSLSEVPVNFIQMAAGVIGGLIFAFSIRKNLIVNMNQVFEKVFILETSHSKFEETYQQT